MKSNYFVIPLMVIVVAVFGSFFVSSGIDSGWYSTVAKPSWTPSGGVIGVAWTTIYILAAASILIFYNSRGVPVQTALAMTAEKKRRNRITRLFYINAVLHLFWTYLFFFNNMIGAAVWDAIFLTLSTYFLVILLWSLGNAEEKLIIKVASVLLLPYAGWVTFATYLNYVVWMLNS